jgi:hypothetical protein
MRAPLLTLLATLLALLAGPAPSQAQERVSELPALAPLRSARDQYVMAFNGRPLQVCQTAWESWNRAHGVCHDLVNLTLEDRQLVAGLVEEFIVYDGVRYTRLNDEATWRSEPDEAFDPDRTLGDTLATPGYAAALTRIGPARVGAVATTHYQFWALDEELNERSGGQAVYDLFITAGGDVAQAQYSARGRIAGLGEGELADIWVYSEHNRPIAVAPPPAELIR